MEKRIVEFIAALRAAGMRISLSESTDAFKALEYIGIQDRGLFQTTLRTTLVKEQQDFALFDKFFELFFRSGDAPPMTDATNQLSPAEARMLADALRRFNQNLREMIQKLLQGQQLSQRELDQLDQLMSPNQETDLRYQNWLAKQLENALNMKEVRKATDELLQLLNEMGMDRQHLQRLADAMRQNQQALKDQIHHHAGETILRNMAQQGRREPRSDVLNRPFQSYTDDDLQALRAEVRRLAAALRTRLSLRLRRSRTGSLDLKSTLRANLKNGSVPVELRHRNRVRKPKLVVVCDISTSMRYCSELMLLMLYAIQDKINKTHAFTFIDHIEYITPYFDHATPNQAIDQVLHTMPPGHYNTDLGNSLQNLSDRYRDTVDHRTTLIVVGDGRNNYNDPRIDLFKDLAGRANAAIWLNPEPPALWGTGDSDMLRYAPICAQTFQVANLGQLAAAIDKLLLRS